MSTFQYSLPRSFTVAVFAGLIAFSTVGCGRNNEAERYPVTGRVTLDGKPLTSGTVLFTPQGGPWAKGRIGLDGSFRLGTYAEGDGAVAGRHRVGIIALDPKALEAAKTKGADAFVPSLIPERYGSPDASGLIFEVKPIPNNTAEFDLTTH